MSDSDELVWGWALVSTINNGERYYTPHGAEDGSDVHVPDAVMLKASLAFMQTAKPVLDRHEGLPVGEVVFAFPMTADIAKAMLGSVPDKTGLIVGIKASPEVRKKYASGEFTGFSIGFSKAIFQGDFP